jgi:hypothetical protein
MTREKDRPDPSLIVEGSRRIQGQDYPTTALEELEQRKKGIHISTHIYIWCSTLNMQQAPQIP